MFDLPITLLSLPYELIYIEREKKCLLWIKIIIIIIIIIKLE
jgi:hypothetical protein